MGGGHGCGLRGFSAVVQAQGCAGENGGCDGVKVLVFHDGLFLLGLFIYKKLASLLYAQG
jgi:hypothetical protein